MNGFIAKTVGGLALGAGLSILAGCTCYRQCVDPCWPERYNAIARASVRDATNAQANNGHLLDQTVWDYFFEVDRDGRPTEVLNDAGREHLHYLARRRPCPDLHLFLQTAQTVPYTQATADKAVTARADLDQRRIAAVQVYMNTLLAHHGVTAPVEVAVIDPAPVGVNALAIGGALPPGRDLPIQGSFQKLQYQFQGVLPFQIVATTSGGSSGGSGGGGSGSGGGSGGGGGGGGGGAGR